MGRVSTVLREEFGQTRPRLHLAMVISRLLPPFVGNRARTAILRLGGLDIGHGTVVIGRMTVTGSEHPSSTVRIGQWCFLNRGCVIDASAPVTIADGVAMGQDVLILTSSHEIGPSSRRAGGMVVAPVAIGQGAWIGARTVVLPGVSIGDGAVVAAGAVVTRDVPADTLVGGVPAQHLRHLDDDQRSRRRASATSNHAGGRYPEGPSSPDLERSHGHEDRHPSFVRRRQDRLLVREHVRHAVDA